MANSDPADEGGTSQDMQSAGANEHSPFMEDKTPDTDEPFEVKDNKKNHPDTVRRALALPILWFLLSTYALTIGAFLVAQLLPIDPPLFSSDDLAAAIAGIAGLQGLAAAVVGFYFGVKHEENKA